MMDIGKFTRQKIFPLLKACWTMHTDKMFLFSCGCKFFSSKVSSRNNVAKIRAARTIVNLVDGESRKQKQRKTTPLMDLNHLKSSAMYQVVHAKPKLLSNRTSRRVEVLNNVFMEQISSHLSTGEVAPELIGLGLKISRVQIACDFSIINIFWSPNGNSSDNGIEKLLPETACTIRHELTQRRVIGMVPPIRFVKDVSIAQVQEVERLLKQCDFGDDFTPTPNSKLFDSPTTVDQLSNVKIPVSDVNIEKESVEMRQNILGVDRDMILSQVQQSITKSKKAQQGHDWLDATMMTEIPQQQSPKENQGLDENMKEDNKRKAEFLNFLKSTKVKRSKELKKKKVTEEERDFMRQQNIEWKSMLLDEKLNQFESNVDVEEYEADVINNEYYEK